MGLDVQFIGDNSGYFRRLGNVFFLLVCTSVCLCVCAHMCMSSSPQASRGPAQEKNPNTFKPERKTDILDESPLVKRRAFYFFW